MKRLGKRSAVAAACLVVGAWASQANAGHLNTVLEARLDGREEVLDGSKSRAMVGDPNGRAEAYVFGVDGDPTTLCYLLVGVSKIAELDQPPGNGRAAHIHFGERGTNGPVVANLAWPQNGQAADCLTEGEPGKFPNAAPGIVQMILQNPQDFYINIHNSVFPAGALRGQLVDTADHAQ